MVTHGEGVVCRGSVMPPGHSTSQFLGFLSIYVYTLCCRTTKFVLVTWGRGSHASREQSSKLPSFWCSAVFMPIPFNAERLNLAWYHMGSGMFLLGQPHHCICTNAFRGLSETAEFVVFSCSRLVQVSQRLQRRAFTDSWSGISYRCTPLSTAWIH